MTSETKWLDLRDMHCLELDVKFLLLLRYRVALTELESDAKNKRFIYFQINRCFNAA